MREGGVEDGAPIPADGFVYLTPHSIPDPDAWVAARMVVLPVQGGVSAPQEISAGRWAVEALSGDWSRRWMLDLEPSDEPVNLAELTPADGLKALPWLPTEQDMEAIRGLLDSPGGGDGGVALRAHVNSLTPHPAYDDTPDLSVIFENGLA